MRILSSIRLKENTIPRTPHNATIQAVLVHFLGNYANWPANIEQWQIYPEVIEYFQNPVAYWQKYKRHHPLIGDDAFDPQTGGYADGYRYHSSFARLGLGPDYADKVAFAELIGVPVSGVIDYKNEPQRTQDLALFEKLLHDEKHLAYLKHLLFEADSQVIFLSRNVYNVLKSRQQELFGFGENVLSLPFPRSDNEFRVLYQHHNSFLVSTQIFSSIRDEAYYPRYRRMIDSIVKAIPMAWEISLPGNSQSIRVECEFKQLESEIKKIAPETENLLGAILNPVKEIKPRLYQLPALADFFLNDIRIKGSINCLIHSIQPLAKKQELLPYIMAYYSQIKHLLEPDNQVLIEACLQESQALIERGDEALPRQEKEIRERFYRFSFHTLKGLETIADKSYYYAEKQLINEIWNTILDNLNKHGSFKKTDFIFQIIPEGRQVRITVTDPVTSFDLENFIQSGKSVVTYTQMQRFGEMSIHSGKHIWSSEKPKEFGDAPETIQGYRIKLCFVLPEKPQ